MNLIQISDLHIMEQPFSKLNGFDTEKSFNDVMDVIYRLEQKVDAIILTGDLSEDGSKAAYQRIANKMTKCCMPVYWIPGNHDDLYNMSLYMSGKNILSDRIIDLDGWRVILLNTVIQGYIDGELSTSELDFLTAGLDNRIPTIIAMHHHPYLVSCQKVDKYPLRNRDVFWNLLRKYSRIKFVLCGHVHQAFELSFDGMYFATCPSTCMQFIPDNLQNPDNTLMPGFRWLDCQMNGVYSTGIKRI